MKDTEHGMLTDYTTGEDIRPATWDELQQSRQAGETGAFDLDGQTVFVAGGPEDAASNMDDEKS